MITKPKSWGRKEGIPVMADTVQIQDKGELGTVISTVGKGGNESRKNTIVYLGKR